MCGTTNAVKPEDEEQLMHQTKKGNEAFEIAFDADEAKAGNDRSRLADPTIKAAVWSTAVKVVVVRAVKAAGVK